MSWTGWWKVAVLGVAEGCDSRRWAGDPALACDALKPSLGLSRLAAGDFGDPTGGRGIVSGGGKVTGKDAHYFGRQRFVSGRVPFLAR